MVEYNGGLTDYAARTSKPFYFRASPISTVTLTIASGQVLKKGTFLQTNNTTGKAIAHAGLAEGAVVNFVGIATAETIILAGLTFTAGTGSVTAAQLVTIWKDLPVGTTASAANTLLLARGINATTVGTFTAGTMTAWNSYLHTASSAVIFVSTTGFAGVTDLAETGTGANPTLNITQGAALTPIAGVTMEDINATSVDVVAGCLSVASVYAEALTWVVNPTLDQMTDFDGTLVNFTAYNTGTSGYTFAETRALQTKFVEGSNIELGFLSAGDTA